MKVVHVDETDSKLDERLLMFVLGVLGEHDQNPKGNESLLEMTYAHYAKRNS